MHPSAAAANGRKMARTEIRGASKHRIKLNRYALSGAIHRKGMAAISCVRWFVTASSSTDALAESPSHNRRFQGPEAAAASPAASPSGASAAAGWLHARQAVKAQSTAKQMYPPDQLYPCVRVVRFGS